MTRIRTLSLCKGLLVPAFEVTEEELHTYKRCCQKGDEYAVIFGDRAAVLYLKRYEDTGEILTGFIEWRQAARVADWEEVKPEPWEVAQIFGHGKPVLVPRWPEPEEVSDGGNVKDDMA